MKIIDGTLTEIEFFHTFLAQSGPILEPNVYQNFQAFFCILVSYFLN